MYSHFVIDSTETTLHHRHTSVVGFSYVEMSELKYYNDVWGHKFSLKCKI